MEQCPQGTSMNAVIMQMNSELNSYFEVHTATTATVSLFCLYNLKQYSKI
jgi:hypothetical protein